MPTSAYSPCVIIQGSDEKARGEVQIKDRSMRQGGCPLPPFGMARDGPAQFSCKEEELVAKVREVLSRHVIGEKRSILE